MVAMISVLIVAASILLKTSTTSTRSSEQEELRGHGQQHLCGDPSNLCLVCAACGLFFFQGENILGWILPLRTLGLLFSAREYWAFFFLCMHSTSGRVEIRKQHASSHSPWLLRICIDFTFGSTDYLAMRGV